MDRDADLRIAQSCRMSPIGEIAKKLDIDEKYLEHYGRFKAKKLVALHDMVIYHRGEQVVCGAYRVDIAGKMQVNILHRHYLPRELLGAAALI